MKKEIAQIFVSVLVPVYNAENYLSICLDSLVRQTLKEIEIICIDDGSTDNSGEILDKYALEYKYITVIHKVNSGYGASLNAGVKISRGKYIGLVESDDYAEPQMFQELYEMACSLDAEIVKSNYFCWSNKNGMSVYHENMGQLPCDLLFDPKDHIDIFFRAPAIWSAIYKRSFLEQKSIHFHATPGASYQDVSFAFETMASAKRVAISDKAYIHYQVDNSMSSSHSEEKINCIFEEYEEIASFLQRERFPLLLYRVMMYRKYIDFAWNYFRIADEKKLFFLNMAIENLKNDIEKGYLDKTLWNNEADWLEIQEMSTTPESYKLKKLQEIQYAKFARETVYRKISKAKNIYIYGAGKVGREVEIELKQRDIKIKSFVVTDKNGNDDTYDGICIREKSKIEFDKSDDLIFIAVKDKDIYFIADQLFKNGFKNVIALDTKLRIFLFKQ